MRGGSKAVWNFSENSSVLEGVGVPKEDLLKYTPSLVQQIINLKLDQIELELELGPRHEYVHHVYEWGGKEKSGTEEWERLCAGVSICHFAADF